MRSLLIALPLLVGFVQDEAAIQDMIRRLDDADLEVREKAVKDLIAAGSKALEPLRKAAASESAEVRARAAQAMKAIELAIGIRQVYPDHKPLSLKRTGTVGEILEDLVRLTGARIDASPEQRALKGAVDAATLLQALDQLCTGQPSLTYTAGDDGTFRFSSDRHIAAPASYCEALKVYLTQAEIVRKSDYKETTVGGTLSLHTVWDGRLKPLRRVRYESLTAKDDAGRDLEIIAATMENMFRMGGAGGGGFVIAGFGEGNDGAGPQAFAIKGLAPESKSVATLTGKVTVAFPLARVDVVFDDPQSGQRKAAGDFNIKLKDVSTGKKKITLTFTRTKGEVQGLKDEIMGRLDAGNAVAVDEDGKEHVGEIALPQAEAGGAMVIMGGPGGGEAAKTATFQATFPTLGDKDIKRFKFRFSDAVFEKTVTFEIKDIKLP